MLSKATPTLRNVFSLQYPHAVEEMAELSVIVDFRAVSRAFTACDMFSCRLPRLEPMFR